MMANKTFHFDFNEDAEPVEELHRLRVATTKHFKTIEAIVEYDRTLPTAKEMIAELKAEIAVRKERTARPRKAQSITKPIARRGAAKRSLLHA
jgi:uncharacterized protein (UPF0276 family)